MIYKCECGREFDTPNSFNGHKAHCKYHHLYKYGNLNKYENKKNFDKKVLAKNREKINTNYLNKKENELLIWISEKHTCEKCGKVMTEKFGSGRFCSRNCANSRIRTEDVKKKISDTLFKGYQEGSIKIDNKTKNELILEYYNNPKLCRCCGGVIPYEIRNHKCCCQKCTKILRDLGAKEGGKVSASKRVLRSKNEIYFCELCEKYFSSVRHNEPIFNGWDADVIIDDVKYAVLWNGPWHYYQLVKNQSLEQIQNRDRIKVEEIKKYGYIPYIIKDEGQYNPEFVEQQFDLFINLIK